MRWLLLLGLMNSVALAHAQNNNTGLKPSSDDNTLLWEVSGNGVQKPGYLFGTFHLLCKEDIRFSKNLKQAVANCEEVYLELDLDDPSTLFSGMMLMQMKDGKKLKDLYSPEAYDRISRFFTDSLQTPVTLFQSMKPEFLTAFLFPKMMPCDAVSSVEEAIMQLAKSEGKEIKGLETMAYQASIFDSIPYDEQANHLLEAIDSLEKSKENFGLMLTAYKQQQLGELSRILNDPAYGMEENQDLLLNRRNENWVAQLKDILVKKPVFVAVGAGHLVGKKGLIALLRAAGYTVTGLDNKEMES